MGVTLEKFAQVIGISKDYELVEDKVTASDNLPYDAFAVSSGVTRYNVRSYDDDPDDVVRLPESKKGEKEGNELQAFLEREGFTVEYGWE